MKINMKQTSPWCQNTEVKKANRKSEKEKRKEKTKERKKTSMQCYRSRKERLLEQV
jgi:hypothetical protein